jgi:hypothetical protein
MFDPAQPRSRSRRVARRRVMHELVLARERQRLPGGFGVLGPRLQGAEAMELLADALERVGEDLLAPPRCSRSRRRRERSASPSSP